MSLQDKVKRRESIERKERIREMHDWNPTSQKRAHILMQIAMQGTGAIRWNELWKICKPHASRDTFVKCLRDLEKEGSIRCDRRSRKYVEIQLDQTGKNYQEIMKSATVIRAALDQNKVALDKATSLAAQIIVVTPHLKPSLQLQHIRNTFQAYFEANINFLMNCMFLYAKDEKGFVKHTMTTQATKLFGIGAGFMTNMLEINEKATVAAFEDWSAKSDARYLHALKAITRFNEVLGRSLQKKF